MKETPKYLLDIIGNVLLAFLLKENVPVEEAQDLAGKVREKNMGMLFENMEKMDIQEERRKTEEQKRKTEEQKRKTEEQKRKTEEQRARAEKAEQNAEEVKKRLEDSIRLLVESCQELGITKVAMVEKLMENAQMSREDAEKEVLLYWKRE